MFNSEKCIYTQDLIATIVVAFLAVIFILVSPFNETPLRIVFALVLIFFIPGYAFIAAMFPKKEEISGIERFTLSVGFSIAIMVFDGFAVSLTRWLFRPNSISISLFLITLVFAVIAYIARRRLHESDQFSFSLHEFIESIRSDDIDTDTTAEESVEPEKTRRFKVKSRKRVNSRVSSPTDERMPEVLVERVPPEIEKALIIALVGSIIIASGMLVYAKMTQEKETFTALYILGADGKAENYPTTASLGQPTTVTVGIENYELSDVNYILQMRLDGNVLQEMTVPVNDGEKWMNDLTYIPTQVPQGRSKLEFVIFKENAEGSPYRSVHLYINHTYSSESFKEGIKVLATIPLVENGDMESDAGWTFTSFTENVNGSYINGSGVYSTRAYLINNSYQGILPQWSDQYHGISQNILSNDDGTALISIFIKDSYTSAAPKDGETQFKQILINNVLIWEDGIGEDEGWQHIQTPVTLKTGNNTLTLRLKQNGHSNVQPVEVLWDEISFQPLSDLASDISGESTIESTPPASRVLDLPEYTGTTDFTVQWNGTDIDSGISYYTIDYSTDNISWYTWISKTTETSSIFSGEDTKTYYFRSKAVDKAGNREMVHTNFDAKITVYTSLPTLTLDISPNPSSGLTSLTVRSSDPLRELNCYVTPREYTAATTSVEMTSSDDMTWTGRYTVRISGNHDVEVIGKDLANNTVTIFDTILSDTSLEYFTIEISPDTISTGTIEIIVTPSVALKTTPSIAIKDGSGYKIVVDSSSISGDEYTYIAT
ncbi:MAG: DUF1616 domain-containing protein, partial [Methanosarcinaceae archaeon]|nr:DUF1616 domain-containing protein [Methanosarcinaceae archaeon]